MGVQTKYRQEAIFIVLLLSLVSLLLSRVGLSVCLMIFMTLTCVHTKWRSQLKRWISTPILMGISTLFFIPLLSGLWSSNLPEWSADLRLKLPLLLYPIAFAGAWQLTGKQWRTLAGVFLLVTFFGIVWSLAGYLPNAAAHNAAVLRSTLFATPLGNDHVRFSWQVSVAVLTVFLLWQRGSRRTQQLLLLLLAIVFIVYLHLLAARTGLLSFYLFLLAGAIRYILYKRSLKLSITIFAIALLLPLFAWYAFPSFQNRIKYMRYDFSYLKKGAYLPGSNDGNRVFSLKAGWSVVQAHPLGVGSGDFEAIAKQWYEHQVPGMLPSDQLFPSSEVLVYGGTAGWLGIFLFILIMAAPFFLKIRHRFYWVVFNTGLLAPFLFDIGLEVQYGVFLYAFVLLWWWKWLPQYETLQTPAFNEGKK